MYFYVYLISSPCTSVQRNNGCYGLSRAEWNLEVSVYCLKPVCTLIASLDQRELAALTVTAGIEYRGGSAKFFCSEVRSGRRPSLASR